MDNVLPLVKSISFKTVESTGEIICTIFIDDTNNTSKTVILHTNGIYKFRIKKDTQFCNSDNINTVLTGRISNILSDCYCAVITLDSSTKYNGLLCEFSTNSILYVEEVTA